MVYISRMKIVYTAHLEFRLKIRNIPHELPRKIYQEAKEHYYDTMTGHSIAVSKDSFEGKARELAVTYDKKQYAAELITIHPIRPYQKHSRITSGRWKRL